MAEYFKKENTHNEGGEATEEEVVVGPAADTVAIVDQGNDSGDSCSSGEIIADVTATDKKKGINKRKDNYRIQVSNTKKPFVFYLNLAKRCVKQYPDVELSALGMAIPTVVTIAEILKRDGLARYKEVKISTVDSKENRQGLYTQKAKIQIVMGKAEKLDKVSTAAVDVPPTAVVDVTTAVNVTAPAVGVSA